jgi:hypothetical protein
MANVQDKVSEQIATAVGHAREAAESVSSKVTDFFQGNPFDSPIGRKIGKSSFFGYEFKDFGHHF